MKIFLDTADVKLIKEWAETGIIDGVTTNPSHLSKQGHNPKKIIEKIVDILPNGVISVQVTETSPQAVYKQALAITKLAPNIVVKVPCHVDYYKVIDALVKEEVPLNITLVFTALQGLMMSKLGVQYISPFVGRLDDQGVDGMQLVAELREVADIYGFSTKILAASIRSVEQFERAMLLGADAVTVPVEVLKKAANSILTDKGMAIFAQDWKKVGAKHFP